MRINLVGINHRTAPIDIREKVAVSADMFHHSLSLLRSHIPQGVILSTCNRTEIYTVDGDGQHAKEASLDFLRAQLDIPHARLLRYVYILEDTKAVEHLFHVACGLDSMIVGEYEVLGQVGHALEVAEKAKMVELPLRYVFQSAIRTGRRARKETGISKNALSISSAAVDLAARVVGDLKKSKVLVVGTGEAGRLVLKVAKERGASQIIIASRSKKRASALTAILGGTPTSLSNLKEELNTCNIVITCAGSRNWILDVDCVREAMASRPELPLVIIDIAVPRNVEPGVEQISNVFRYSIDDLANTTEMNLRQREGEIEKVEKIKATEVAKFVSWQQDFEVRPVIKALMRKADDIRCAQLERTLKQLPPLSDEQLYSLEAMTKSIVAKMLKEPMQCLKANGNGEHTDIVKELFQLETDKY